MEKKVILKGEKSFSIIHKLLEEDILAGGNGSSEVKTVMQHIEN